MRDGKGARDGRVEAACAAHRTPLEGHARRLLKGREAEVPDLVQETFERFVRRFQDESPPGEPACALWLYTTLTNVCISYWRKQQVRLRSVADPALHVVAVPQQAEAMDAPPTRTALDTVLDEFTNEAFKKAVESLSRKLRSAYELHLLGLSHNQIADRLGLQPAAVRKRIHDARKHLKERLKLESRGDEP